MLVVEAFFLCETQVLITSEPPKAQTIWTSLPHFELICVPFCPAGSFFVK